MASGSAAPGSCQRTAYSLSSSSGAPPANCAGSNPDDPVVGERVVGRMDLERFPRGHAHGGEEVGRQGGLGGSA